MFEGEGGTCSAGASSPSPTTTISRRTGDHVRGSHLVFRRVADSTTLSRTQVCFSTRRPISPEPRAPMTPPRAGEGGAVPHQYRPRALSCRRQQQEQHRCVLPRLSTCGTACLPRRSAATGADTDMLVHWSESSRQATFLPVSNDMSVVNWKRKRAGSAAFSLDMRALSDQHDDPARRTTW